jgi:hypothetical protein
MNARTIRRTWLGFFVLLAVGCASTTYEGPQSGFLAENDYSLLKKMSAPGAPSRGAVGALVAFDAKTPAWASALQSL